MKKIFMVFLLMIFSTNVFAQEYMFNVLEPFGPVNGFFAAFIVIMQLIIVYLTGIGLIYSAVEMLANPDIPKLLTNFIGSALKIALVLEIPSIIVKVINGFSSGGNVIISGFKTPTSELSALAGSRGFKALFDFIISVNVTLIVVFLLLGVIILVWSSLNYISNQDLSGLIKHLMMSVLFIFIALSLNEYSIMTVKTTKITGTEINIESINFFGEKINLENLQ